jgi:hypothetical protein
VVSGIDIDSSPSWGVSMADSDSVVLAEGWEVVVDGSAGIGAPAVVLHGFSLCILKHGKPQLHFKHE